MEEERADGHAGEDAAPGVGDPPRVRDVGGAWAGATLVCYGAAALVLEAVTASAAWLTPEILQIARMRLEVQAAEGRTESAEVEHFTQILADLAQVLASARWIPTVAMALSLATILCGIGITFRWTWSWPAGQWFLGARMLLAAALGWLLAAEVGPGLCRFVVEVAPTLQQSGDALPRELVEFARTRAGLVGGAWALAGLAAFPPAVLILWLRTGSVRRWCAPPGNPTEPLK